MNKGTFSGTRRNTRSATEGGYNLDTSAFFPTNDDPQSVRLMLAGVNPPYSKYELTGSFIPHRYQNDIYGIGTTWSAQGSASSLGTATINAALYANGLFLLGNNSGVIQTSADLVTWTTRTSNFGASGINKVAYGNGIFVAVGVGGQIRSSTDAITWTTRTSNFLTTAIASVAYGNNVWVAVGAGGAIRTSTDAVTWTTPVSNFGTSAISSLTFGNGIFVAGGAAASLRISTDGTTWTTQTIAFGTTAVSRLAYGNGVFVAQGTSVYAYSNSNGTTWTTQVATFTANSLDFGYNRFVSGGAGLVTTSISGKSWTDSSSIFSGSNVTATAFGNNLFLIVQDNTVTATQRYRTTSVIPSRGYKFPYINGYVMP